MKYIFGKLIGLMLVVLYVSSCSTAIDPIYTYSPEMPKAGEKVTFTNSTAEGKYWNWEFGDGSKSVSQNPVHYYNKPGIYNVTLMVDSNKNYVLTKVLTVYDSIPTIHVNKDSIKYFESVEFSALIYNPFSYNVTYKWKFSDNAVSDSIRNGVSDDAKVNVYFKRHNVDEIVDLQINIGDSVYNVKDTFYVHDVKAQSILFAGADGKIYRQRIFQNGMESYFETPFGCGTNAFNIQASQNQLFVFKTGPVSGTTLNDMSTQSSESEIFVWNMADNSNKQILTFNNLSAEKGVFTGFADSQNLYWSDYGSFIYRSPINSTLGNFEWKGNEDSQTSVPYYLVKYNRLNYYGVLKNSDLTSGFAVYDQTYFWSKGNTGKGIYRFTTSDIQNQNVITEGTSPALGPILTDYSIRSFAIDKNNQMIYFAVTAPADKVGLWVARINGTNAQRIDNAPVDNGLDYITQLVVDNESNYLYWAYRSPELSGKNPPSGGNWASYYNANPTHITGIKRTGLIRNYLNVLPVENIVDGLSAYGITLDEIAK